MSHTNCIIQIVSLNSKKKECITFTKKKKVIFSKKKNFFVEKESISLIFPANICLGEDVLKMSSV